MLGVLGIDVGDPSLSGWVIFFSYFGGALLCGRALAVSLLGARLADAYEGPERRVRDRSRAYKASVLFWGLLIGLFLFLGMNKQIDLQTWITMVGRDIARKQGWYEQRGQVQTVFVLAITVGGLAVLSVLLKLTRDLLPRHMLAFFGLILLALYLVMRASSFHDIDDALRVDILGVRIGWMLELGGIYSVSLSAFLNTRWYRVQAWQFLREWEREEAVGSRLSAVGRKEDAGATSESGSLADSR